MTFEVAGEAYDRFMGRYSRPLAADLAALLAPSTGQRAIDVGCGPGALTGALVERLGVDAVAAVDPSAPFVEACGARFPGVDVRQGTADSLPFDDDTFDLAAAGLVVHFMPDPVAGLTEMARVTRAGGWVAATVWDLAGSRAPMWPVWEAFGVIRPGGLAEERLPAGTDGELRRMFEAAGLRDVEAAEMPVTVTHGTFEEWWTPYLKGVGPIGEELAALDTSDRQRVEDLCRDRLGAGPFDLTAVAYAVRGRA
ncbi:Ubiquinone/menaquinone biosynthesis C-methylase UbiE [Nocardioides alpinus]|uniref:Class I SAM-dependent methyltransferase n=1 Tax=Nocardioides alpinus TaxID=748909 RepID=A0A1I0XV23_9ACTN|nr:class I SAM-dependent methyltransferase [Nocardioides alpinus]PKH42830.1 class I SAM-dependent methyltransferase [Nocardioides alpinus]SFB04862.1 Ubiquinone/menaquinone biosynthesis C-methylase UbiE [Nocardioides alpinus]